jgi:chromosome segregation ATPase
MKLAVLPLLLAVLLTGCGGRVDARKLLAKQAEVTQHVTEARAHFAAASVKLRDAKKSNAKATERQAEAMRWMTIIVPAVEQLALKVPDDLKPEVEALRLKVESLSTEITAAVGATAETKAAVDEADTEQDSGIARLTKAEAGIKKINERLVPEVMEQVNDLIEREAKQDGIILKWRLLTIGTWAAVIALFAFKNYLKTVPFIGLLFR